MRLDPVVFADSFHHLSVQDGLDPSGATIQHLQPPGIDKATEIPVYPADPMFINDTVKIKSINFGYGILEGMGNSTVSYESDFVISKIHRRALLEKMIFRGCITITQSVKSLYMGTEKALQFTPVEGVEPIGTQTPFSWEVKFETTDDRTTWEEGKCKLITAKAIRYFDKYESTIIYTMLVTGQIAAFALAWRFTFYGNGLVAVIAREAGPLQLLGTTAVNGFIQFD